MLSNELDKLFLEIAGDKSKLEKFTPLNDPVDAEVSFIAFENEQPVGCIGLKGYDENCAELKRLFVRPVCRGHGISKLLLSELEKEAVCRGYKFLILQTARVLASAVALYEKAGFEIIDNYGPYAGMTNVLCMRKNLLP